MKRYQQKSFRPVFGIASAAALSALTIALAVVVPVGLATSANAATVAACSVIPAVQLVTISPSRVDVVVVRSSSVAAARTGTRA